jgi:hypothetical protein
MRREGRALTSVVDCDTPAASVPVRPARGLCSGKPCWVILTAAANVHSRGTSAGPVVPGAVASAGS